MQSKFNIKDFPNQVAKTGISKFEFVVKIQFLIPLVIFRFISYNHELNCLIQNEIFHFFGIHENA